MSEHQIAQPVGTFPLWPLQLSLTKAPPQVIDTVQGIVPQVGVEEGRKSGPESRCERSKVPDALNGWSCLLDFAQSNDQQKVDTWKDELNNLLVFAGLFSAVVTAFTIESYQWLQPDSEAISMQLLAQISLQLSSLTVSQGFVNSTAPPMYAPTTFQPDHNDVVINFLWFLSLTLSLLSAFFAIAAQQWLRSLPLPPTLPIQEAVRLQRSRQRALTTCQVPSIIALLPVMLQIAVVLFLVGVYYLLRSLSHPITTAYAVIAGIPFIFYALSFLLPLLWYDCPFKSPLIPSIAFAFNWGMVILAALATVFLVLPIVALSGLGTTLCGSYIPHFGKLRRRYTFDRLTLWILETWVMLTERAGAYLVPVFTTTADFWTHRQTQYMYGQDEPSVFDSMGRALQSAPLVIPIDQLGRVRQALLALPVKERVSCVLNWVRLHFEISGFSIIESSSNWSPINIRILDRIDARFARHYQSFLQDALPTEWSQRDWIQEVDSIPAVFAFLTRITKTVDPALRPTLVPALLQACKSQRFLGDENHKALAEYRSTRYPTVCLLECTSDRTYQFSHDDAVDLVSLAQTRISTFVTMTDTHREIYRISVQEMVLALCSTSLIALETCSQSSASDPDNMTSQTTDLLRSMDRFVTSEVDGVRFMGLITAERPTHPFIVTRRAVESICRSLIDLAEGGRLTADGRDVLSQLVGHLLEACAGEEAYGEVMPLLTRLRDLCATSQPASALPIATPTLELHNPKYLRATESILTARRGSCDGGANSTVSYFSDLYH